MDLLTERRVQRRTARVNKRRVENNPLWASGGEAALAAVAGPVRTEGATWNELVEMQISAEARRHRLGMVILMYLLDSVVEEGI